MGKHNSPQHIINYIEGKVEAYSTIKTRFNHQESSFRFKFNNNVDNYISAMQQEGKMLVIQDNGVIKSPVVYSPKTYAKAKNIKEIKSNIDLVQFDKIVADKYGFWNYPLNEYKHIVENGLQVVVVKFELNGTYRFVQV